MSNIAQNAEKAQEKFDQIEKIVDGAIKQRCSIADISETITESDFEVAMLTATLSNSSVTELQGFFLKDDKYFYRKLILFTNLDEKNKKILENWYPHHKILNLPQEPKELEKLPLFIKEITIIFFENPEIEKRKNAYRKRILHRHNFAITFCDLSKFLNENFDQLKVKEAINESFLNLEIPSYLVEKTDSSDLFRYKIREAEFLVENLIPATGITMLSAHPKTGKSFLALNIAKSILNKEPLFGELNARKVGVYYLALEDNAARLRQRLKMVFGEDEVKNLKNFYLRNYSKKFEIQVLEELKKELLKLPDVKFLIIDTFQKIKVERTNRFNAYEGDYDFMSLLKNLAEEIGISILLIHHLKKDATEDADLIGMSGSMGISASCDSILTLWKKTEGFLLKTTSKDAPDRTIRLVVDEETWIFSTDEEEKIAIKGLQREIVQCLEIKRKYLFSREICDFLGKTTDSEKSSVRNQLTVLRKKGKIFYKNNQYSATLETFSLSNIAANVAVSNP
jgi:hypothetical protein